MKSLTIFCLLGLAFGAVIEPRQAELKGKAKVSAEHVADAAATATISFGQLPAQVTNYGNPLDLPIIPIGEVEAGRGKLIAAKNAKDSLKNDADYASKVKAGGPKTEKTAKSQPALVKRQFPTTAAPVLSPAGAAGTVQKLLLLCASGNEQVGTAILDGLSTPYQVYTIPLAGAPLPSMESADGTIGQYDGIVIISAVAYSYGVSGYGSALSNDQLNYLFNYQVKYGARMVQLGVYPTPDLGVGISSYGFGCCGAATQNATFVSATEFPSAGLKINAQMSTSGLYHYPAVITDATSTTAFMNFGPSSDGVYAGTTVGGVISKFASGRQQMSIFIDTASWSLTSSIISHAWATWVTRGAFQGYRRVYFQQQVDDIYLSTDHNLPTVETNVPFVRVSTIDLDNHIAWSSSITTRMNPGSSYVIELAFNGNGNEEQANNVDATCPIPIFRTPDYNTPLEFFKPVGSGTDQWPLGAVFNYNLKCNKKDTLGRYFTLAAKRDAFAWVSHTFTHEDLDNATYADATKEMKYNQQFADLMTISAARLWSPKGLVPPAISGMHNGDALRAMSEAGIVNVVGDNSRSVLRNQQNFHWPYTSNVASDGFAGIQLTPRWATNIYFDVSTSEQSALEWRTLTGATGTFNDLLWREGEVNTNNLISLFQDAYMFHQANLRTDITPVNVNGAIQTLSLMQAWVEVVVNKFTKYVNWPMVAIKHDDLALRFRERQIRDRCTFTTQKIRSGSSITGITVTPFGTCAAPIPVTVPGSVVSSNGFKTEQLGSDPLTIWADFSVNSAPVTFTLNPAIPI